MKEKYLRGGNKSSAYLRSERQVKRLTESHLNSLYVQVNTLREEKKVKKESTTERFLRETGSSCLTSK